MRACSRARLSLRGAPKSPHRAREPHGGVGYPRISPHGGLDHQGPALVCLFLSSVSLSSSLRAVAGQVLRSTPGVPRASVYLRLGSWPQPGIPRGGCEAPVPGASGAPTLCAGGGSLVYPRRVWGSLWRAGRQALPLSFTVPFSRVRVHWLGRSCGVACASSLAASSTSVCLSFLVPGARLGGVHPCVSFWKLWVDRRAFGSLMQLCGGTGCHGGLQGVIAMVAMVGCC